MNKLIIGVIVLAAIIAGALYYLVYPPAVYKRDAQRMLDSIGLSLASQNRDVFKETLTGIITDSAAISLEIDFPAPPGQREANTEKENFPKPDFIHFTDNVLFSLKNYSFTATAETITLAADKKTAFLDFSGKAGAEGLEGANDSNMRYRGDFTCHSGLAFDDAKEAKLTSLACTVQLKYALKH